MPEDKLLRFLLRLADDPSLTQRLRDSPLEVLCASDLSEKEKQLVLSADPGKIRAALGDASEAGGNVVVIAAVVVVI